MFLYILDNQAPEFISCPQNEIITVNTTYRTNVATNVQWEVPKYFDNSIAVEGDQLTLSEQNGYKSPRDFKIGETKVKYTVRDKSGLEATCEITIKVQGKVCSNLRLPRQPVKNEGCICIYSNGWSIQC